MDIRAPRNNLSFIRLFTLLLTSTFCLGLNLILSQEDLSLVANFKLEHVELPGGPGANSINSIVQGPDGFIWLGGHSGLYRYDGYSFKHYSSEGQDSTALVFSYIEFLLWDSDDYLWIGTYGGGLFRFNPDDETFIRYEHDADDPTSISNDRITCLTEDMEGKLWVGTTNGLNRMDRNQGTFEQYLSDENDPRSLSYNYVRSVYVDRQGTLWAGTGFFYNDNWETAGGLNRFHPETRDFSVFLHDPNDETSLWGQCVKGLYEDAEGRFWVGSTSGLQIMDRETGTFTRLKDDPNIEGDIFAPGIIDNEPSIVHSILGDKDGNMWIFTLLGLSNRGSISRIDNETGEMEIVTRRQNVIPWETIQAKDGTIWLAGAGVGNRVFKIVEDRTQLRYTPFQIAVRGVQTGVRFHGIIDHPRQPGNILGKTFSMATNEFQFISHTVGQTGWGEIPVSGMQLDLTLAATMEHGYGLAEDSNGLIWGSTGLLDGGIFSYNLESGELNQYLSDPANPNSPPSDRTWHIINDRKGHIWFSTNFTVSHIHPETGEFRHYDLKPDGPDSLGHKIFHIYVGNDGYLWIGGGSQAGLPTLCRLNPLTGEVTRMNFSEIDRGGYIRQIAQNQLGDIIFLKGGDKGLGVFTPDIFSENVPNGRISGDQYVGMGQMVADRSGILWLVNTRGAVVRFDSRTRSFTELYPRISGQWPGDEAFIIKDGTIFYNYAEGLIAILPSDTDQSFHIENQEVKITDLELNGTSVSPGPNSILSALIWDKNEVNLKHNQSNFSLRFSSMDFNNPNSNLYEVRMLPGESEWRRIEGEPSVHYYRLPPGNYEFQVRGSNSLGVWNDVVTTLDIHVSPPWYKSILAYLLYGGAFFGILYLIRRSELKKQRAKLQFEKEQREKEQEINDQLRQVDALKDQFLANTSHELRTPLNGIIGLSESLIDGETDASKRENLSLIVSSGKRLSSLVNDLLDFSKLKNFDIQLQQKALDLHSLADIVLNVSLPLVKNKSLELINSVATDLPAVFADENRLQQILHNLVGNAIKFTEKGSVEITAEQEDEQIKVWVKDTGIGISRENQNAIFQEFQQADGSISREFGGTGLGLSISRQLVKLHGGDMGLESDPALTPGTRFWFTLPVTSKKGKKLTSQTSISSVEYTKAATQPVTGIPSKPRGDQVRILVVDDEPINLQVLKNHLKDDQFELTFASNGDEALSIIESQPRFDLILLDVMMPKMSGYEVCERIRENHLPSELPIIMVTAKNQVNDLVQGLELGANDYLTKPFSKEEFHARVKTQLDLHRIFSVTGKFIPNEFIQFLGRERITEVKLGDQTEKKVTVLFTDIRDYTSLAEEMSPEENFGFVRSINAMLGPIIKKHHGFINQYLGDGIMAIFPNRPADALHAAIEMQHSVEEFNDRRHETNKRPIKIGIGLHSGNLIMGIIGDESRLDAATIADTVNTASRVENLTKYFRTRILLSEDSYALLGEDVAFSLRYLGQVIVKGKKKPIGIYECFDGDSEESQTLKAQTLSHFNQGIKAYYEKDFSHSMQAFEQCLRQHPDDLTTEFLLEKASKFVASGVDADWTGVDTMSEK